MYEGFKAEIKELCKSIEFQRRISEREDRSKLTSGKHILKELKKLENNANYDQKDGGLSEGVVRRDKGMVFK